MGPSALHVPSQPAGGSNAIEAAPSPGHFAADTCIDSGNSHAAGEHEHEGHVDGAMGSA